MKRRIRLVFLLTGLALAGAAHANEAAQIKASHAWIRLLPANLPAGGYVVLRNVGSAPATLVGVSSDAYASAMLHQSTTSASGMSGMSMLEKLPIPARDSVALAPSGYHLMLSNPTHTLKPGDSVQLQLRFGDGSVLDIPFIVRPANALGD